MRFLALLAALMLAVVPGCNQAVASDFHDQTLLNSDRFLSGGFNGANAAPGGGAGSSLLTAYHTVVTSTESLTNSSMGEVAYSNGGSAFTVVVDEQSWWNETSDRFEPDIAGLYILQCRLVGTGAAGRWSPRYVVNGSAPFDNRWSDNEDNQVSQSFELVYLNGTTDTAACAWATTATFTNTAEAAIIGPIATSPTRSRITVSDTISNNSMGSTKFTGTVSGPTVNTDAGSIWDATDKRWEPSTAGWYFLDCTMSNSTAGRRSTHLASSTTYATQGSRYADNNDHWVSGSFYPLYHDAVDDWSACAWASTAANTGTAVGEIYGPIGSDAEVHFAQVTSTESMSNNSMGDTKFSGAGAALTVQSDAQGYWDATDTRFEPTTAGWYILDCELATTTTAGRFSPSTTGTTSDSLSRSRMADNNDNNLARVTTLVKMNGTTDHIACAWSSTATKTATAVSLLVGPVAL